MGPSPYMRRSFMVGFGKAEGHEQVDLLQHLHSTSKLVKPKEDHTTIDYKKLHKNYENMCKGMMRHINYNHHKRTQ